MTSVLADALGSGGEDAAAGASGFGGVMAFDGFVLGAFAVSWCFFLVA